MPRAVVFALVVLVALDAAFVTLHVVRDPAATGLLGDPRLSLAREFGYGEILGYLQLGVAAVLVVVLHRRREQPVYLAWAAVLAVVVIDDALSLHEEGGEAMAAWLGLPGLLGLRGQDVGELVVWALLGGALLAPLLLAYRRSGGHARADSHLLLILVLALGLFAVVVDMVHVMLSGRAAQVAGAVEGAGELLVPSAMVAYVLAVRFRESLVELPPRVRAELCASRQPSPARGAE